MWKQTARTSRVAQPPPRAAGRAAKRFRTIRFRKSITDHSPIRDCRVPLTHALERRRILSLRDPTGAEHPVGPPSHTVPPPGKRVHPKRKGAHEQAWRSRWNTFIIDC
jgi:hypothetical protein